MTDPPPCPRCAELEHACRVLEHDAAEAGALVLSHEGRIERLEALLREVAEALAEQSLGCSCRSCRACQAQRSLVDRARETLNGGS